MFLDLSPMVVWEFAPLSKLKLTRQERDCGELEMEEKVCGDILLFLSRNWLIMVGFFILLFSHASGFIVVSCSCKGELHPNIH